MPGTHLFSINYKYPLSFQYTMSRLTIRLPDDISAILERFRRDANLSSSEIVRRSLLLFLKDYKGPKTKTALELKRSLEREKAYVEVRDFSKNAYLLKNAHRRIMDMALNSYFLTHKINMILVERYVKSIEKVYQSFEPHMKKAYRREMEVLKSYKREPVLMIRLQPMLKRLNMSVPMSKSSEIGKEG